MAAVIAMLAILNLVAGILVGQFLIPANSFLLDHAACMYVFCHVCTTCNKYSAWRQTSKLCIQIITMGLILGDSLWPEWPLAELALPD
jgi:hypothetical protein